MKESIQIFKNKMFGTIRITVDENGEPLFCLKDVCMALLLDGKQVTRRLDDGVVSKHPIKDSLGRCQMASFVNEDGLYDTILDSRKAEARAFRKWITAEVLPQIRKTGGYIPTRDADGRQLTDAEVMLMAQQIAGRTLEMLNAGCDCCLTAKEVAKMIGIGVSDLNSFLCDIGVQQWRGGQYQLTDKYANRGLTQVRTFLYYGLNGKQKERSYMVWTPAGVDFINEKIMN